MILPERIDNTYRGHPLALWLFVLVVVMKTGIALGTLFNGRAAAQSADGIPLDRFGVGGAEAVVALFAIWGLSQLFPFMFALLLLEHLARKWILLVKPIPRTGTPPGTYINLILVTLMIGGLALSLWRRSDVPATR